MEHNRKFQYKHNRMKQLLFFLFLIAILAKCDKLEASLESLSSQNSLSCPKNDRPEDHSLSYFSQNQKNYRLSGFSVLDLLEQQNIGQNGRLSNKFTLSFQYACRQTAALDSCKGAFYWNTNLIKVIQPFDFNIHNFSVTVEAEVGFNMFQMQGKGISDSYGLDIDNVKLIRFGTIQNIVVNGDFQSPNVEGTSKIQNDILGWKGTGIKVGNGKLFNCQWKSQVCELDGLYNCEMVQYFRFDSHFNLINNSKNCSR